MDELWRLAIIGGDPISRARRGRTLELRRHAGDLGQELTALLSVKNGFYAFESALHVFPLGSAPDDFSVLQWNEYTLWRSSFDGLADAGFFFAEDVFGNQFCIHEDHISIFDVETGEFKWIAHDLEGWAGAVLEDFNKQTSFPIAHRWQLENGPIPRGYRLVPRVPFVIGGEYELSNLRSIPSVTAMRWYGRVAKQIHSLPDGASVSIEALEE